LIGGGVLHVVEIGALAGTPLAAMAGWRLVLLLIGAPGLLWALAILLIREPVRHMTESSPGGASDTAASAWRSTAWARVVPIYLVVATASLVDNAVGGWAPSLLIRDFARDAAQVGMELGVLLTIGFGGGVLLGGWLADRVGGQGNWSRKLAVCLCAGVLILPDSLLIDSGRFEVVLLAVPLYFALSGIVTACGFSAILDVVPNRWRALAMAISFFLNVALGAALGPSAVTAASTHIFGAAAGLGPAIALTVAAAYSIAVVALVATLLVFRTGTRRETVAGPSGS
jgi:MFS family permease